MCLWCILPPIMHSKPWKMLKCDATASLDHILYRLFSSVMCLVCISLLIMHFKLWKLFQCDAHKVKITSCIDYLVTWCSWYVYFTTNHAFQTMKTVPVRSTYTVKVTSCIDRRYNIASVLWLKRNRKGCIVLQIYYALRQMFIIDLWNISVQTHLFGWVKL